jgi:RNA binding exosome subunit
VQQRITTLADQCLAGEVTPKERAESEANGWAGELIAILQAKTPQRLRLRVVLAQLPRRIDE